MTVVLLLGCGVGAGLFLVGRALRPRPIALATAIHRLHHVTTRTGSTSSTRWTSLGIDRIGGAVSEAVGRDLRVVRRTVQRHAIDKLTTAIALTALAIGGGWSSAVLGLGAGPGLIVFGSLGAAVGGFFVPDLILRTQAADRRRQFQFALSSYLDLVNVLLAGGAGVESALEATAQTGDGWAFEELRTALLRARTMRRSPWSALGELGEQLGIEELIELAASIQLAGEEGARIRSSLSARAAALRGRQLAQIEADANAASERLGFPTVAMFVGFLALLAYPALQQIAGS